MHRFVTKLIATAAILGASLFAPAQAAPVGLPDGVRTAIDGLNIVELAHMMGHHNYCWYEDGWNGAGWYQCGYAGRKNYGWGGPYGWHGWAAPMWGHRMGMYGHHMMMGRGCCW